MPRKCLMQNRVSPVLASAAERARADGFDAVLLSWRHGNVVAAMEFLKEIG